MLEFISDCVATLTNLFIVTFSFSLLILILELEGKKFWFSVYNRFQWIIQAVDQKTLKLLALILLVFFVVIIAERYGGVGPYHFLHVLGQVCSLSFLFLSFNEKERLLILVVFFCSVFTLLLLKLKGVGILFLSLQNPTRGRLAGLFATALALLSLWGLFLYGYGEHVENSHFYLSLISYFSGAGIIFVRLYEDRNLFPPLLCSFASTAFLSLTEALASPNHTPEILQKIFLFFLFYLLVLFFIKKAIKNLDRQQIVFFYIFVCLGGLPGLDFTGTSEWLKTQLVDHSLVLMLLEILNSNRSPKCKSKSNQKKNER